MHTRTLKLTCLAIVMAICGPTLAAVVTISEPRPETTDGQIELLRKIAYSLDAAADAAGN